jgi:hypothetical protein
MLEINALPSAQAIVASIKAPFTGRIAQATVE